MTERNHRDLLLHQKAERLLRAASAPEGMAPSPFFKKRVLNSFRETGTREAPFGLLAWRSVPLALVVTILLAGWSSYETSRTARMRQEALASLLNPSSAGADAFLAAAFFASGPNATGERP